MLSPAQLKDICLLGEGCNECRYLDQDRNDSTKYICKKKCQDATIIDEEVDLFLEDCRKEGVNPKKKGVALGDHCAGYIPIRDVLQGYDV